MERISPFITDSPVLFLKEVLLVAEQAADDWRKIVPEAYAFKSDCRRALDVIQPLIEDDIEFRKFLAGYIKNGFKDTYEYRNDRHLIMELVKDMITTQKGLDEFLERIKATEEGSFLRNRQAYLERIFHAGEYRMELEAQRKDIAKLINDLEHCCQFQEHVEQKKKRPPILEDFKDDFKSHTSMEAYNFWKKHVGPDTSVAWCIFVHAYGRLYGSSKHHIDLGDVKEHLATKQGEVDTMSLHAFITLVDLHGFPFKKNAHALEKRKHDLSDGARMEVAKMVMKLMDQFASKEMQANFLAIEHLYKGVDKSNTAEIERRAKEWGAVRGRSLMTVEANKSKEHKRADEVDFARRAVSFLYQRYMVIWRVGQLERDTLKEVDFPGTGRIREFLAYYLPLDKTNFHDVRKLEPERWDSAKPNVYNFLEQLVQDKTKEANKKKEEEERKAQEELADMTDPKIARPTRQMSTFTSFTSYFG